MFYIFLSVIMFAFFYSPSAYSMEYSSLEDGPLKSKYLQEQQDEELSLLNNNHSLKSFYTVALENGRMDQEEISEDDGAAFPCEVREHILEYYYWSKINNKKELIPALCHFTLGNNLLSPSYKEKVKRRVAFCHALYIINKMKGLSTEQEFQQLRITASSANRGNNCWNDIPTYTLWKDVAVHFEVRKQLRDYVAASKHYAMFLKDACEEFPEFLPLYVIREDKDLNEESIGEKEILCDPMRDIVKSYYDIRYKFLNDSGQREAKWRKKINALVLKSTKARHFLPCYCCCMGCIFCACICYGPSAIGVFNLVMGTLCVSSSVLFFCLSGQKTLDSYLDSYFNKIDYCDCMTGLPDNQKYIQRAQGLILESAELSFSQEDNPKTD